MRRGYKAIFLAFLSLLIINVNTAYALEEVGSDSRIRTLIYGKNDVYRIITTFGYQTTVELHPDEKIKTISLGNSSSFKITPQKNRLFIRALQGGQLTNMIVITNERTYQFELSSILDSLQEMMYVVKFYYPDNFNDSVGSLAPMSSFGGGGNSNIMVPEVNLRGMAPQNIQPSFGGGAMGFGGMPSQSQPLMPGQIPTQPFGNRPQSLNFSGSSPNNMVFDAPPTGSLNYNYSLTGPDYLSPSEVYDDGIRTFIKFKTPEGPIFKYSSSDGKTMLPTPVNYTRQGEYYVLDGVTPKLTVFFGSEHICIYNEAMSNSGFRY